MSGFRPAQEVLREGMWAGQRAFVIGGGPSASAVPFELLKGENVIAVNRAHECGVADLIVTGDARWLNEYRLQESPDPATPVIYACRKPEEAKTEQPAYLLPCAPHGTWGTSLSQGVTPGCSGIRAANLAYILGAGLIYLVGFDLSQGPEDDQEWWHQGYTRKDGARHYGSFRDYWGMVAQGYPDVFGSIFNLSPNSAIGCARRLDWRKVLA